ncbi:MAG: alkyl hydroperoxide reductase subunit F [Nitrospirae bacterium]|nr:MAG: alkyl hydroperoxide reductase subunit F [Nitrospirota bacterium]
MKKDPVCNMDVREDDAITAECDGLLYYFCSEGCKEKFLKERICKVQKSVYDLIIIGGGPAGLTAAVYAATLKMDALLVTKDLGGQAIDSTKIENYMGFDFIKGPELIEKFQYQLIHSHYIDHLMSEVEKVGPVENGLNITTSKLTKYFTKSLIIATGMTRKKLNVEGEEMFQRRGIFYGNIQDISFVQGEDVAVVGGGNSALQVVENLCSVAKKIYLISDFKLTADPVIIERVSRFENLTKYEGVKIVEFSGESALSGIAVRKKAEEKTIKLPVKGVFIAIGLQPNSSLVAHLVKLNDRSEIVINPDCSTSYSGIFAAGDVTNAFGKRIVIASGEGAKAALAARQYILNSAALRR